MGKFPTLEGFCLPPNAAITASAATASEDASKEDIITHLVNHMALMQQLMFAQSREIDVLKIELEVIKADQELS